MPKAFISGGGGEIEPEFIPAAGDLAEYYLSVLPWAPDLLAVKPWAQKMAGEFQKDFGVELSCNSAEAYAIFYVLMDALEGAGSTDREKIREALANTNITEEGTKTNPFWQRALLLPYKQIQFGPDGQNMHVRIPICQFQKKRLRIIFPPDVVPPDVKPVWPAPGWNERQ
jgi:branched-chain amino acid transport system substrate-binding protein